MSVGHPVTKRKGSSSKPRNGSGPNDPTLSRTTPSIDEMLTFFEDYVHKNEICIGDVLPSEEFFVNAASVSRTTVRETFGRLKALGIVSSKQRRGMKLLRDPALIDLVRLLSESKLPGNMVGHVGGFRSALELGLESVIFERATPGDVAALAEICAAMEKCEQNTEEWSDLDFRFHQRLVQISQNLPSIWLLQLFRPFFDYVHAHRWFTSTRAHRRHQEIVMALQDRDAVAFHLAMREHHIRKIDYGNYDPFGQVVPSDKAEMNVATLPPGTNTQKGGAALVKG